MMPVKLYTISALLVALVSGQAVQQNSTDGGGIKRVARFFNPYDPYGLESPINLPASYYNRESPFVPGDDDDYVKAEGRSGMKLKRPFVEGNDDDAASRLLGFTTGLALGSRLFGNRPNVNNNQPRPFAQLGLTSPVQLNPNFPNLLTTFDSCTSPNGQSGICTPGKVCGMFGGQPSGSCLFGGVCCVNTVSTCVGGTVTLNNTFWQSPTDRPVDSSSSCILNIKIDNRLVEQKKPICQVRLDFISFSIAQPDGAAVAGTATSCSTDSFQVAGATNVVPTICGDNNNQHMYLHVPNSDVTSTDLQLLFRFGNANGVTRSWNIRVSMLPCGASFLAPTDCLQFFTSASGSVRSFNFADTNTAVRQLGNQDYNISVSEPSSSMARAVSLCLAQCTGVTTFFHLSNGPASGRSQVGGDCTTDFMIFPGGTDSTGATNDRYCGEMFNPTASATAAVQVCSTVKPFRFVYRTNRGEAAGELTGTSFSNGFCFDFSQRT